MHIQRKSTRIPKESQHKHPKIRCSSGWRNSRDCLGHDGHSYFVFGAQPKLTSRRSHYIVQRTQIPPCLSVVEVDGRMPSRQPNPTQVFRLEEKTGSIPGGGSAFLRWRFLPLEAKEYVLRVTVRTVGQQQHDDRYGEQFGEGTEEQTLEITVRGVGYDPRMRDPHRSVSLRGRKLWLLRHTVVRIKIHA